MKRKWKIVIEVNADDVGGSIEVYVQGRHTPTQDQVRQVLERVGRHARTTR